MVLDTSLVLSEWKPECPASGVKGIFVPDLHWAAPNPSLLGVDNPDGLGPDAGSFLVLEVASEKEGFLLAVLDVLGPVTLEWPAHEAEGPLDFGSGLVAGRVLALGKAELALGSGGKSPLGFGAIVLAGEGLLLRASA